MWLAHGRSAWIGVLNRAEPEPPSYPSCLAQSALILCSGRVSPRVSVFRLRMAPPNPERRESSEEGAPVSALPVPLFIEMRRGLRTPARHPILLAPQQ
ncbi:unnamed protein product [Lampetra fluviatilis]